jgi:hypothetical protein
LLSPGDARAGAGVRGALLAESLRRLAGARGRSSLFPPYRWQLDARAVEPVMALVFDGRCLREKREQDQRLGHALAKYQRLVRVRVQRLDLYRNEP